MKTAVFAHSWCYTGGDPKKDEEIQKGISRLIGYVAIYSSELLAK
ncbi:hypothetical protein RU97_GL000218 [Enterococcus canis]|uniref:Uncharacterized protein n=1 Tax=Enterococcus canis TaxID=214095 RepID=A0A1L8RJU5_9ENTE|nr:hypothetical protein RU97_GL000218 [Enterococcus canis]